MARKRKPLPLLEGVTITDVAAEGKALARVNDLVVFVPYVAPGDIVDIQLIRKKHNYAEGKAVAFHKYAEERAVPFCEHFGVCGGCKWQHLPYEAQLRYKQKQVIDNLTRIGKVDLGEILPIMGSEKTRFYRNKLEFTFSNKKWLTEEQVQSGEPIECMNGLGFHIPNMFDKVLDINKCWLQADISNRIRLAIKNYCLEHEGYPFYDLRNQEGFVRTLMIRTASTGDLMVVLVFYHEDKERREALLDYVAEQFPEITSLLYVINNKLNDTITDLDVHTFKGEDHIFLQMEGLKFKVGPKSFYQTNPWMTERLYLRAMEAAGLGEKDVVIDAYSGIGTIGLVASSYAKEVIGIEEVEEAVRDAERNREINGRENFRMILGDCPDVLTGFAREGRRCDVLFMDPPRKGSTERFLSAAKELAPRKIVYVSCNPATLARDIAFLLPEYRLQSAEPFDMFPMTPHVETLALLVRRDG